MAYDNRTYSEFFEISPNYFPVISEHSIKKDKDGWKRTFPHATFVDLLEKVNLMLAGKSGQHAMPIWIEGAYGVGKSRVIWTISSLLTCSDKELDDYFASFHELKDKYDLRKGLHKNRQKPIVTPTLSGLRDVNTTPKFIRAIFDAIQTALRKRNMAMNGDKTLRGRIVKWLEDPDNADFFKKKLNLPRYRDYSASEYDIPELCEHLNTPGKNTDLLDEIVTIAEQEGIHVFNVDLTALQEWIAEVIRINDLGAIVFFWDEFTSFFKDFRNFDVLQEMAHLSSNVPFYLFLATHMSAALGSSDDQEYKKIRDRFTTCQMEMPNSVAFDLIANAIQVRKELESDYRKLTDALNQGLAKPRQIVCEKIKIKESVMEKVLPLHPMAALMLKYIAGSFGSNQRSIFNFIKTEANDDVRAFQYFAENNCPASNDLLTIDQLWDFFYRTGVDDNTGARGRDNLDIQVAQILDVYERTVEVTELTPKQSMVLQTVLMMDAISRRMDIKGNPLVPTEDNIILAFEGLDKNNSISPNDIRNALSFFKKQGVLFHDGKASDPASFRYIAALNASNSKDLDLIIQTWLDNPERFLNLIGDSVADYRIENPRIQARFVFLDAFAENFTVQINKLANMAANDEYSSRIYALRCFARLSKDAFALRKRIKDALTNPKYADILFLDLTGRPLGEDALNDCLTSAAKEEYFRPKDTKQADGNQRQLNDVIKSWARDLQYCDVVVQGQNFNRHVTGDVQSLVEALHEYVLFLYPLSFDNANVPNTWFNTQLKKGVECGVKVEPFQSYGLLQIKNLLGCIYDVQSTEYWTIYPNEPLSVLKRNIIDLIKQEIQNNVHISIGDIVNFLTQKCGFMSRNIYAFLIGFLLKEYCQGSYRYSIGEEGNSGGIMTAEKIAELVDAYFKHLEAPNKQYSPAYLEKMTKEQDAYLKFVVKAFQLKTAPDSVENATTEARVAFSKLKYPLWPLALNHRGAFADMLMVLVRSLRANEGESVSVMANDFGKLALKNKRDAEALAKVVMDPEALCSALRDYLASLEDGLFFRTAERIGVADPVNDARNCFSSSGVYLWDQNACDEEFHKLLIVYQIIEASCALTKFVKCSSFDKCLENWRQYVNAYYITSYEALKEHRPQLASFLECLFIITKSSHTELPYDKRQLFLNELREKTELINNLLETFNDLFRQEYGAYVGDFDDRTLEEVYGAIRNRNKTQPFFCKDRSAAQRDVEFAASEARSKQARNQLITQWKKHTGTSSPREWSAKYRTPILGMVPTAEREIAREHFQAMQSVDAKESQLKSACDYLAKKPAFLQELDSQDKRDRVVVYCLAGKLADLFNDPETLRAVAEKVAEPYDWFDSAPVHNAVKSHIERAYRGEGYKKAVEYAQSLAPEKAQEILVALVRNDAEVAVVFLKSQGLLKE